MAKITVNPVQRFRSLLPGSSRTFGTVASVDAVSSTTVVTLQSGDQVTVKGSAYQPGDRVLIADGELRQKVPALPASNVTIF